VCVGVCVGVCGVCVWVCVWCVCGCVCGCVCVCVCVCGNGLNLHTFTQVISKRKISGADKSLARPGREQAATVKSVTGGGMD